MSGEPGLGGKALALRRLERAGFPVPRFAVVTADRVTEAGVERDARAALDAALPGPGPYAVRSSGGAEDGADASHAGQFETRLDVAREDLDAAILAVWRSGSAPHLAAYAKARGQTGAPAPPSIIVQEMVRARAAGVLFTADPVTGASDVIRVSAVHGLADRLVAGEVDGDDYALPKKGPLPAPGDGPLSAEDLAALRALALAVEAECGGAPQDIEWAFDAERLHLLQSRPITTLGAAPASQSAAPPDDRLVILDNSNIVESYPGLVSPLTFSFARAVYAEVYRRFLVLLCVPAKTVAAHRATLQNLLARHDGRTYYNLVEWYRALALLPGFGLNRGAMEQMMGVSEALPAELARSLAPPPADGWRRAVEAGRVARVAAGLLWQAAILGQTKRRFEGRLGRALASPPEHLATLPLSALAAEYRRIEADLLERWDAPLVNDFLCMMAFAASRGLMRRFAGEEGVRLHADVMVGQGDIVSAEPAQRVRALGRLARGNETLIARLEAGDRTALGGHPELAAGVGVYLKTFGDRCVGELKLESLPLTAEPAPLLAAIAAAARAPNTETVRPDPDAGFRRLFAGRPFHRALARSVTTYAKRRVRDRENLRFERTRLFGRARALFLQVGERLHAAGRLDSPRDVFLLTVEEVLSAIEGSAVSFDLRGLADLRRREMEAAAARPDPGERLELRGAVVTATPVAALAPAADTGATRTGTGCSAGRVTALARVVLDPASERVRPGEILVARHTDPGWIALFANAAGIVVERGSLLSHSAIVARELGLPCVVGLKGACVWLASGDRIALDGAAGTVTRLEEAKPDGADG